MNTKLLTITIFVFLLIPFISAFPGIPHQFYGSVTVNGEPAPDNNIIRASAEGDIYMTATKDGRYGFSPDIFYVEDPEGNRAGRTVFFYVGGKQATTVIFENNGYTRLDLSLTTECGDNYCLGDETCGNCATDCGICTSPPVITISSPQNIVYETTKVNLDVSADQPILLWMYSLDSANFITFTPNIILTLDNGDHTITVLGINQVYQTGNSKIDFSVKVPYCGDGICANEDCSSCAADCGACPVNTGGGSGGGGSGGGGGGITKPKNQTNQSSNTGFVNLNLNVQDETSGDSGLEEEQTQEPSNSGILGAVTGLGSKLGKTKSIIVLVFVVAIFAAMLFISIARRRKN